jgi:ABC-2 type transport system permease protein
MSWQRIKALLLASYYYRLHSYEAIADIFWWSFIAIVVFGFTSLYLAGGSGTQKATILLSGMILWDVIRLGQESISLSVLREVWSRNLSNIFTTPLSTAEFLTSQIIASLIQGLIVFFFTSTIAYVFYGFSIFVLSWQLIFIVLNLLAFSWAAAFFVLGLIFRYGTRIQVFAWTSIFIVQPFCGAFYPLEILPHWMQVVGRMFPITYAFEAARISLETGVFHWNLIITATLMNGIYMTASILFFNFMFRKSKENGTFARLEG